MPTTRFEFATATQIIFGTGALSEAGKIAAGLGSHALVVVGGSPERAQPLYDLLTAAGVQYTVFSVSSEPTVELARAGVSQALAAGCDVVIGFGGGSAIDAGKAIAALISNGGDPLDYLEVIGRGQALCKPSAPYIAIPTTAGTGAEVTRNAVLDSPEHQVKVSLRSPYMLPRVALVDPALTYSLPPAVTASTGMDALAQVIEPFVSNKANPLTDSLCREGITRAARSLRRVFEHGDDAGAREDMAIASLFSGLALANAKLGAVHGFAGVLGGMFDAPHGAISAVLLPLVMETNVRALQQRQPDSDALPRYDEIARLLTRTTSAMARDGVASAHALCQALQIARLSAYGMTEADIPMVVEKAAGSSSLQGNPIKLTADEMNGILLNAL